MGNPYEEKSEESEVKQLREEVRDLQFKLIQLAGASTLENALARGFDEITQKLGPLEDLRPKRDALDAPSEKTLRRLQVELARPKWGDPAFDKENWTTTVPRRSR